MTSQRKSGEESSESPSESLTAYERWELPVLKEAERARQAAVATVNTPRPEREAGDSEPVRRPPPTAAELESIREAAYQEGLEQGYAEGLKKGHDEGFAKGLEEGRKTGLAAGQKEGREQAFKTHQDAIIKQLGLLQKLLDQLRRPVEREQQAVEASLVDLVAALARVVIGRDLQLSAEPILQLVQQAVAALPDPEGIPKVFLNPRDITFIQGQGAGLQSDWQLLPDPAVEPGGCRVETRESEVDFTVSRRFMQVVDAWLQQPVVPDDELPPVVATSTEPEEKASAESGTAPESTRGSP